MSQMVPGADGQRETICGGLNKNGLYKLLHLNALPLVSKNLERINRCGLIGRDMPLNMGSEAPIALAR